MSHLSAIPYLDRPTDTNADKIAEVGAIRIHKHATLGMQMYRMVFATAQIEAKELVAFVAGSNVNATKSTATNPASGTVAGIAVSQIPINNYGWVCCSGAVVGLADAAVAQNAPVMGSATDGQLDDANLSTNEHTVVGIAITNGAAFSGGEDLTVRLSGLI